MDNYNNSQDLNKILNEFRKIEVNNQLKYS